MAQNIQTYLLKILGPNHKIYEPKINQIEAAGQKLKDKVLGPKKKIIKTLDELADDCCDLGMFENKEEAMKIIPYFNEQKVLYGMTGVLSGHKYKILTFEKMSEKGTIKFKIEDQRSEYPCNSIKII